MGLHLSKGQTERESTRFCRFSSDNFNSLQLQPSTRPLYFYRRALLKKIKRSLLSKGFIKLVRLNHERHVLRLQDEHDDVLDEVCLSSFCFFTLSPPHPPPSRYPLLLPPISTFPLLAFSYLMIGGHVTTTRSPALLASRLIDSRFLIQTPQFKEKRRQTFISKIRQRYRFTAFKAWHDHTLRARKMQVQLRLFRFRVEERAFGRCFIVWKAYYKERKRWVFGAGVGGRTSFFLSFFYPTLTQPPPPPSN